MNTLTLGHTESNDFNQIYLVFLADINSLGSSTSRILKLVGLTVSIVTLELELAKICLILVYGHCRIQIDHPFNISLKRNIELQYFLRLLFVKAVVYKE